MMENCNSAQRFLVTVFAVFLVLVPGSSVFAEPYLQLDATSAIYLYEPEESIFSTEYQFTLYALVNHDSGKITGKGDGGTDGNFYRLSKRICGSQ